MKRFKLDHEPGWIGMFTRCQADGALPNGTEIVKKSAGDETAPVGTRGVVLGSLDGSCFEAALWERYQAQFMYFVEWDVLPGHAVSVVDWKIAAIN